MTRWGTTVIFLIGGAAILKWLDTTRIWEALGSAWVLDTVFQVDANAMEGRPDIFIYGDLPWILSITLECAGALIIVPFLAIAAALTASGRFQPGRMVAGVGLATAVVIAVNQTRIAAIGAALASYGLEGYGWWHTVGGSVMTLVGIAVALLILWAVAIRTPRTRAGQENI